MVTGSSHVGYGALVGLGVGCFARQNSSNFVKEEICTYIPIFLRWGQVNGVFFWSFSHKKWDSKQANQGKVESIPKDATLDG